MKLILYEVRGLPVAVIDDYYNDQELEDIWSEINFLNRNNKLSSPKDIGAAIDEKDEYLKSGTGLFLHEVYIEAEEHSEITRKSKKLFSVPVVNALMEKHFFFDYIRKCEKDDIFINYYENKDFYKKHFDEATITTLTWLYKEPKGYEGGDMILDGNLHIPCLNNRIMIFPSIIPHEVTEIKMITDQSGYGRYSIVHFIN